MIDYLQKQGVVHIPKKPRTLLNRFKKECEQFINKYSREPTQDEIAELLNIPVENIQEILNFEIHFSEVHYESITDINTLDEQTRIMIMNDVNTCLKRLSDEDQFIFISIESKGMTATELTKQFKRSKNTIRNRNIAAKKNMLKCLKLKGWAIIDE